MLDNCNYNKVRLLHDLSRIAQFLKKHAKKDAKKSRKHGSCHKLYGELEKDLDKHIGKLNKAIGTLAKKGYFK